ncbi:hypothetical protein [Streptomyces sp. NPDC052114]|uniref:hypothetical protein n=1 Tax=unclassified Streptomyces TaxID=2593676 RepID=UPI003432B1B4
MTHRSPVYSADPHRTPRSRPRPRPQEPRLLPPMLPGTDEPPAPAAVRASFALWLAAVAAGVFGTVLAVPGAVADGEASLTSVGGGPALRMAVFSAAVLVAVRMRRGSRAARAALACAFGVLGALSVVAGPVRWLADGQVLGDAFRDVGVVDVLSGGSRVLLGAAALTAVVAMFRPTANAWFRRAGSPR